LGTGLFSLGFSPIQKTVVTILFFHGYRSPGSGEDAVSCPGENAIEPTSSKRSSDDLFDFLLALTLGDSAFEGKPWAKRDETDESITAMV
jgi:hypothetical protein